MRDRRQRGPVRHPGRSANPLSIIGSSPILRAMTANERDQTIWVPRIGPDATAARKRYWQWRARCSLAGLVLAIGASFAFASHKPIINVLGGIACLVLVAMFVQLTRATRELNTALREYLAGRLPGRLVPPTMTEKQFDNWLRKRGVQPRADEPTANPQ